MTDETLLWVLGAIATLQRSNAAGVEPVFLHHPLSGSPMRASAPYPLGNGDVFVYVSENNVAAGGYFWFDLSTGNFDLHLYTLPNFRRQGLATKLFHGAILPWLQSNGYKGITICTTALASNSLGLLRKLGFARVGSSFEYTVP